MSVRSLTVKSLTVKTAKLFFAVAILVVVGPLALAADPPDHPGTLAVPIVAPLSGESAAEPAHKLRARLERRSRIRSPGGQLGTTVALIALAFFIARITSRRGPNERAEER